MSSNIEIDIKIIDDPIISCDETLIIEVIKNILKNSIEAITSNGNIVISSYQNNGYAFISIKDNGMGIPKNIQNQVFDFCITTKEDLQKNNHGLGLYFCQRVIYAHKADISFQSNEAYGTTLFLKFKINKSKKRGNN